MGKHHNPAMARLFVEGTKMDKALIREEELKEVNQLISKMPTDPPYRLIYVRNLVQKVLGKQLDLEVFKLFVKKTNSYEELQTCMPRAKMLMGRR